MNLWAAMPIIAVASLSGATGVHATAANHFTAAILSPTPSVALPSTGAPSPVLRQVGSAEWETIVLLDDTGPACGQVRAARYWLATTAPNERISASVAGVAPVGNTEPAASALLNGSACQVTLVFPALARCQRRRH